jgi:galacturan 1,4-alpha-galacturonidase
MPVVSVIGASTLWFPTIATDLLAVFNEPVEFRLFDIDPKSLARCVKWGESANRYHKRQDKYLPFTVRRECLRDADAVLICVSTGGFKTMAVDIAIPEKYGIFATVGDTTGPSGLSRAIRNIPVFADFARDCELECPNAFIVNYSNPMSALTAALQLNCSNPVVGLCHAYFETKDRIRSIFGLPDWNKISLQIGGVNHFHWVIEFKIGKEDGYQLLQQKIGHGNIRDLRPYADMPEMDYNGKRNIYFGTEVFASLYDVYGYLPYSGDRHTAEFLNFTISQYPELCKLDNLNGGFYEGFKELDLVRTSIAIRKKQVAERTAHCEEMIAGTKSMPERSRETAAEMIYAYINNQPFIDAVNMLNIGQIPGLPLGACVETLGMIDSLGVHPCTVPEIPESLLELMRTPALCQKWLLDGVLQKDKNLILQAFYHDPQCVGMKPGKVRELADDILNANQAYFKL